MRRNRTRPDWSNLQEDLLYLIGNKLHTRIDKLRFRAVCNSFRSSFPLPPKAFSPYTSLVIPMQEELKASFNEFSIFLTESTVYAIEPLHEISDTHNTAKTWVVTVEESNSGKVNLKDPLPGFSFHNLLPNSLNLLDYRVKEIIKDHSIGLDFGRKGNRTENFVLFVKGAISSCFDEIDDKFALIVGYSERKLGLWRIEEKKWIKLDNLGRDGPVDIVYHKEKFYALDASGLVTRVDPKSTSVTNVAAPLSDHKHRHLLKSCKDLLLVVFPIYSDSECVPSNEFVYAFKFDEDKCDWVYLMNGLEDRMVFLRHGRSFPVLAEEFSECKRNRFYSTDDLNISDELILRARFVDLENHMAGPFSDFPDYSKSFWPPPNWLKHNSSSNS